jgi:hypothetical protein
MPHSVSQNNQPAKEYVVSSIMSSGSFLTQPLAGLGRAITNLLIL